MTGVEVPAPALAPAHSPSPARTRRSRFGEVFRFEAWYRLTRPATWLYAAALIGMPILFFQTSAEGPRPVNAPLSVASAVLIAGVVGFFVSAGLVGETSTRDARTNAHALFFTAPITKFEYLIGRYAGAFAVNLLLLLTCIPIGSLAGLVVPYADDGVIFAPFSWQPYVVPLLLIVVPTAFSTSALMYMAAVLSRRAITIYLSGIALFISYLWVMEQRFVADKPLVLALIDPMGMEPISQILDYWTPAEKNVNQLPITGLVFANRAVWIAVGIAALAFTWWRFRFEQQERGGARRRTTAPGESAEPVLDRIAEVAVPVRATTRRFGPATALAQLGALTARTLADVMQNRLFLGLVFATALFVFAFGWEIGRNIFGTFTWPVASLMAGTVIALPFAYVLTLLGVLFAGELVWREREARTHELLAAAPVAGWVPVVSVFLAVAALLVVLLAVAIVAGMGVQAAQGYYVFEPLLYLQFAYGVVLPRLLIFVALSICVHVLVDQKGVGNLAVVGLIAATFFASRFGIRHNLLIFAGSPGVIYSDMNRFGPFVGPYAAFMAYWGAWAFGLMLVATLFWVRGTSVRFRERAAYARQRLAVPAMARMVATAGALIVATGGFVFYNTNILNEYRSPSEAARHAGDYERRYQRHADAPLPRIVAAELRFDLLPEARAVRTRGTYTLVNDQAVPVESLHVQLRTGPLAGDYTFDRPATLVVDDTAQRYRIYRFAEPLAPGDTTRMTFTTSYGPRGFTNGTPATAVARNGAYFDRRWLPMIGYQRDAEIGDSATRVLAGLPPRPPQAMPRQDDAEALRWRNDIRTEDRVAVDVVISTAPGQTAITPGRLVRAWDEGGRRLFHYRSDLPLPFGVALLSGEYAVREDRWRDVALKVLHHPAHDFNIDRVVASMKASLEYFSTHFGPYPFDELRVVEFPRYASFARAHPYTIAFSEGSALLTRVHEGDIDRPFFVIAHETAHQWWGNELAGARVRGVGMLSETLAQYSALMVMETTFGEEAVRRFLDFELDSYLLGRGGDPRPEPPLVDVESQDHIYYRKGSLAMYTLRERIGAEAVNAALRRLLDRFRDAGPPFPTSRDLVAELRAATPDSLHGLFSDLFERVTFWGFKTDSARVERVAGGRFQVTLGVTAGRFQTDSAGVERELPLDELVEIGVYGPDGDNNAYGKLLYLQPHRITSGSHRLVITVDEEPGRAGIDPRWRFIQRSRYDNSRALVMPLGDR